MKTFLKRFFLTVALLLLFAIISPFLFMQFGSESAVTSAKMLLNAIIGYGIDSPETEIVEQRIKVAEGFNVGLYAKDLGKIRFMYITEQGDLLVSRPRSGDILLLERDRDGDGQADGQRVLMTGLIKPHGLDSVDGWLYIAESTAVGKVRFDEQTATITGDYQRIVEGLGDSGNHWTKTLRVGPDGWLYLTSGSTCNVCVEDDEQRATMMRFKADGSALDIFASGLRNSVGFDWAPWDQSLYATDNGRDLLGDDFPPCELNKIERGGFYGWPYINGFGDLDPDMQQQRQGNEELLARAISPVHGFRAHNAPLGITFLRHISHPGFQKVALAALHGSWNRSERDGYKVVSLHWQSDGAIVEKDFLVGFKGATDVIGRPTDVIEGADGSIYVSDDYSGTIFRIRQGEQSKAQTLVSNLTQKKAVEHTVDPQQALAIYSKTQLALLNANGQKLFKQHNCGSCHDATAQQSTQQSTQQPTQTIIPLDTVAQRYTLSELADFFLTPTPPMPVYPLNDQQREALAVYLYDQ